MIFSKAKKPTPLVDFINEFAHKSKRPRYYKRKFWNLARKLKKYEDYRGITLLTDSLKLDTFEDLVIYLQEKYNYRLATVKAYQQQLSVVLNRAAGNYPVNFEFRDYKIATESSAAVCLDIIEIETLHNLAHLSREASAVRDIFVVGCCTGLRFSDYSRLTKDYIAKDIIRMKTRKTGAAVIIPVHWMIREVIERNNGEFPRAKSQQTFNKTIKRVCRKAGIRDLIYKEQTIGGKAVRKKFKKYELVSSHTARRSFATNLYLQGVSAAKIMLLTGHSTEQSFFKYIRIDKEKNAKDLAGHAFFQKTKNPLPLPGEDLKH